MLGLKSIHFTKRDPWYWLHELTHCGLVTPYGDTDLDQHWLLQWLVARQHQAITRNNADVSSESDIHLRAISQEIHQPSITNTSFKIIYIRFQSNLPRVNELTLNVRGPSYLGLTRSVSWLLMHWLLTSPGHQQPWYWLCRIGRFLSYLRKDFKYLRHTNVEKCHKMQIYVYVASEKFSM